VFGLLALILVLFIWRHVRPGVAPIQPSQRPAKTPHAPAVARNARPAVPVPLPSPDTEGNIQVCGIGRVRVGPDSDALNAYANELIAEADARWRASLLSSDDYRARAAGLYLQGLRQPADSGARFSDDTRSDLIALAVATHDPAVYAIALQSCLKFPEDTSSGSCPQVSADGWSRIDPHNAVPWLLAAADARARGDAVAEATAFDHAAEATESVSYGSSLYSVARASLPDGITPLQRLLLAEKMIGYEAAWAETHYRYLTQHCSAEAVDDRKVRNECSAVADLLAAHGTTLLDLGEARVIGSRVGWSSARLKRMGDERDALMQELMLQEPPSWGCQEIKRSSELIAEEVRIGERAAAMESLEVSGSTVEERAAQYRDAQRTRWSQGK
jgi:hypothetical protein